MELDAAPSLTEPEEAAVVRALSLARVSLNGPPPVYSSAWRRAGVEEAVDPLPPGPARYALSPRSTRGATRA